VKRPQEPRVAVRNAGDEQQVKRATESDRAREERERNEDVAVWNTYQGRAFTRRVLADCGVFRLSFAENPHFTSFNEGGRNVGLRLLARMNTIAPELYLLMEQEHLEREAREPRAPEPKPDEETDATSN
jgi:hypothetical protein